MPISYDRWKRFPTTIELLPSGNVGVYAEAIVRDKLGRVRDVGNYQGDTLTTHCAMFSCNHLWHGERCTECPSSIASHQPREWPGQVVDK